MGGFYRVPPLTRGIPARSGQLAIKAIGAGNQRARRFEPKLGEVRVPGGDVRGVRDNEIKSLRAERLEPAPVAEFDLERVLRGVALRHREGRRA
jgi:hypothetical protein